jgi:arylsulfatase A
MMPRVILLLIAGIAGLILSAGCNSDAKKPSDHPNIIFILADDMGYGDAGCYNPESGIPTPNIDRLAAEGMRFSNAHSPGSWCVPSRYGLLTGQYPIRRDMSLQKEKCLIDPGQPTIATILKKHGYFTICIGKWHLGFDNFSNADYRQPLTGGPIEHGFDYFFGMHASLDIPPYFYIENDHAVEPPTDSIEASHSGDWTRIQGAFWRAGKIAPGFVHEQVLPAFLNKSTELIEKRADDQPFFLYLALSGPHTPWLPEKKFTNKSRAGLYGDFVVQIDQVVGKILQKLDELALAGNTLIIFTSDNGPVWYPQDEKRFHHESNGLLRGMKADLLEGGHRMPFIARWPGNIKAGSVSDEVICFTDMLATFAALVNDTLPGGFIYDSYNLLPVLRGEPYPGPLHKETIVMNHVIFEDKWKLIEGSGYGGLHFLFSKEGKPPQKSAGELYDIFADPGEQQNLYKKHPEIVKKLSEDLQGFK